jgi:hypothetical protein
MSSAVVYSNAFKLKTELQPEIDYLLSFSTSLSSASNITTTSLSSTNAALQTVMAKIDQLDKAIAQLNDLGRREMVASKREVVSG